MSGPNKMSQSAVEAVEEENLTELTRDAFLKVADYLNGELEGTSDDYQMLAKINKVAATKYADVKDLVANVHVSMQQLDAKYHSLGPYIEQIDHIELAVNALEQSAFKLDAYSKKLEARYKELERR